MASRLLLALNVSILSEADPSLKLVLIETPQVAGEAYQRIGHLGVEMGSSGEVEMAISKFDQSGLVDSVEKESTCYFAVQDKVWVHDPDGVDWEYCTVLADAKSMSELPIQTCC